MCEEILRYDSVEVSFGEKVVVSDVSFSLRQGEILGLVGESGSGKSTLIKATMGLLGTNGMVTKGDILYKGQNILDITEKEKRRIRGAQIGMIFQDAGASLCPIRTIGEQIYESMRAHRKISKSEAKSHAMELFEKLHFRDGKRVWDSYPFELSGGMNQRAGIAIAMLMNPPILFADEPTSALDVTVQRQVINEMLHLRELFGTSIIIVTHDLGVVKAMADTVLVLKDWKKSGIWKSRGGSERSTGCLHTEIIICGSGITEVSQYMSIILEAEHLTKIFRKKGSAPLKAVDDISFQLKEGETLGIVGESGSGKSTLAKLLTRLTDSTSGTLKYEGKDITMLKGSGLRELYGNIQMVFQDPVSSFDPRRTLGVGIGESLRNRGMKKEEIQKRVEEVLEQAGLDPRFAARYPHEVSGGQCQRAAIARALAVEPKILICDEATSALDVTIQKQIMELLQELKEQHGLSFIFICHNLALVQMFCDRVLVLYEGRIVESGTTDEIIQSPGEVYTKKLIESVFE